MSAGIRTRTKRVPVQGDKDGSRSDLEGAQVSADNLGGPKFKFWVSDRQKQKLDYARATALLFTLNLVFGTEVRGTPCHICPVL